MALACVMACGRHSVNEILHNSYGYSIEETQMASQDLHGRQNICRCCISEMSGQHRPWQKPRRCKTNSSLTDRNGRRRKQCRSWGSAFVPGPPKTQRLKTNVLQLLSIDPSFWDAFRCQSDGSWSYTKCLRPQALFGWISRFPTQTTANALFNCNLTKMTGTNRLANPMIRSVLYGGNTHAHPLAAARMLQRFCMRCKGNITWSNQPGTPTQAFRKWMTDFKWDEIAPWRWRPGSLQLSLRASAETTSQAHQTQVWRQTLLQKWGLGPRHEAQPWQWRSSPLQMRGELEQIDLEAARKAMESTSANGRAIMLDSICSPAMLHK